MRKKDNIRLGQEGEALAVSFLVQNGLKVLERNYRCRLGEIDIIAVDDDTLVFIEVKARKNFLFGLPEEAITMAKQTKLIKVANYYIKKESKRGLNNLNKRIDIIAVHKGDKKQPSVRWIKNAVEGT